MKRRRAEAPPTMAGIVRYEEDDSVIKISPTAVLLVCIAMLLIEIYLSLTG